MQPTPVSSTQPSKRKGEEDGHKQKKPNVGTWLQSSTFLPALVPSPFSFLLLHPLCFALVVFLRCLFSIFRTSILPFLPLFFFLFLCSLFVCPRCSDHQEDNFLNWKINEGDLVVLSSEDGQFIALATGIIYSVTPKSVLLSTPQLIQFPKDHNLGIEKTKKKIKNKK